ncbi:DUF4065 domain-containing protein [Azospirillum formosense]|uniref:DUF4065 domain-containing protein n=1 Tax=Azospirillum formosense TaxID=861533 RepID=A0ABX2KSX5_9PROT|nr:type II toxin-antitoxin system antitoxin SocA domain-containing protein [Azospirillum formosense]MBY3757737.1 SocA family protein [Azospirillum formosense]NUB18738.1 DUF4065 domain-containing protein [Azospirillum formosense]
MAYDGRALANLVLEKCDQQGRLLTHMALQKVLYYAHGWHLAEQNAPLVAGGFEAWQHGPVIRSVYKAFKGAGDQPIKTRATALDMATGIAHEPTCQLTLPQSELLDAVIGAYAHLHAYELSNMTHEHGSPWDRIWNSGSAVTPGMRIPDSEIKEHFIFIRHGATN